MYGLKRKKETIEDERSEPAKDPPIVKSVFFLGLNFSEWMNSKLYIDLVRLAPFYKEFRVGLLVTCH